MTKLETWFNSRVLLARAESTTLGDTFISQGHLCGRNLLATDSTHALIGWFTGPYIEVWTNKIWHVVNYLISLFVRTVSCGTSLFRYLLRVFRYLFCSLSLGHKGRKTTLSIVYRTNYTFNKILNLLAHKFQGWLFKALVQELIRETFARVWILVQLVLIYH